MQRAYDALQAHKYPTLIIAFGILISIALFQIALRYDIKNENDNFRDIAEQTYRTLNQKFDLHTGRIDTIAHFAQRDEIELINSLRDSTVFSHIALHDPENPDINNIIEYPDLNNALKNVGIKTYIAPPYYAANKDVIMPVIARIPDAKPLYIIGFLNLSELLEQEFKPLSKSVHVQVNSSRDGKTTNIYRKVASPGNPIFLPHISASASMAYQNKRDFNTHSLEIGIYNPSSQVQALPWITLVFSLGCTTLLGYLAMHISTENIKIKHIVDAQTQDLRAYTRELESANQDLDDFIHISSHDLKEPLRGIRNYADIILEDPSEIPNGLKKIQTLSLRMDSLITALMEYSVIAREPILFKTESMTEIVQEAVRPYQNDSSIKFTIHPNMPRVECNRMRMRQVFENLISNAIRFNEHQLKTVEIGCIQNHPKHKGQFVYFVRDNGIGITFDDLDTVIKIFRRLNHPNKYGYTIGAGLTHTSRIIHRHNGELWFELNDNEGMTAYFTLQRT